MWIPSATLSQLRNKLARVQQPSKQQEWNMQLRVDCDKLEIGLAVIAGNLMCTEGKVATYEDE